MPRVSEANTLPRITSKFSNIVEYGDNNVRHVPGTSGIEGETCALFATDRNGTWCYIGIWYSERLDEGKLHFSREAPC